MSYLAEANIIHGDFRLAKGGSISKDDYEKLPERLKKKFVWINRVETMQPKGLDKTPETPSSKDKTPPIPERKK
jgi:hypothetical protein